MDEYQEGAADYERVLDSQRALLTYQTNMTQTVSSVATNLIALYKALGGGWELAQGQPVVPDPTRREMTERTNWGGMLSQPKPK
jgi:outer membrane protein TolC